MSATESITDAANRLIVDELELARRLAWKYRGRLDDFAFDDLRSECLFGLIEAATAFDPARGVPFGAYATFCIKNRIAGFYRRSSRSGIVYAPGPVAQTSLCSGGIDGDPIDIAARQGGERWTESEWKRMLQSVKPRHRPAIELRFRDGLTYAEIAKCMRVKEHQVSRMIDSSITLMRAEILGGEQ
jgi:RNA polymerase sigma factor (sigma-70 family)